MMNRKVCGVGLMVHGGEKGGDGDGVTRVDACRFLL
jgi:hypothetical protein